MILDAILDALLDTAKTVPFLLAAFLLLETLEHYSNNFMNRALGKMARQALWWEPSLAAFPSAVSP